MEKKHLKPASKTSAARKKKTYTRKKKRRSFRFVFLYLLFIGILTMVAFSYKTLNRHLQNSMTTFKLEDIEISGNSILSKEQILDLCGLEKGAELIKIIPVDVVEHLIQSPYIKSVSAVRSLPSRLRIVIEERKPVAFIHGRGLNLIDAEGVLIPVPETNYRWDLPFISGISEPLGELGKETISLEARKGVEILNYLNFMASPAEDLIAELKLEEGNLLQLRLLKGGAKVYATVEAYQENLFVLSEYAEKYLNWDSLNDIEYLDVRFEDQLIIKEHKG